MTTEPSRDLALLLCSMTPDSIIDVARRAIHEIYTPPFEVICDDAGPIADGLKACVTLRVEGIVRGCWSSTAQSLQRAVASATLRALLDPRGGGSLSSGEILRSHVEVWIQTSCEEITQIDDDQLWGTHGAEVQGSGCEAFFLPCVPIEAKITEADDLLERLFRKARISKDDRGAARLFKTSWAHFAETSAVVGDKQLVARYHRLLPVNATTGNSLDLRQLGLAAGRHLLSLQRVDGSYVYWFDPIKDVRNDAPSPVRQIGCTLALARLARAHNVSGGPAATDFRNGALRGAAWVAARLAERDGTIVFESGPESGKLGSVAFASLTYSALPEADRAQHLIEGLNHTILGAQRDDGSFTNDLRAADARGSQDLSPGQALLALALQRATGLDRLMPCFNRAFAYYSGLDIAKATPFFLAWQAKAWCELGSRTRDSRFADFAYAMLDHLLLSQISAGPDDFLGGYRVEIEPYDSRPPSFLAALFTEAMIMGWQLAAARGDRTKADHYRASVCAGLLFLDRLVAIKEQAFLFRRPELAFGGVRKDLASFELRCDYTMHAVTCIAAALNAGLGTISSRITKGESDPRRRDL